MPAFPMAKALFTKLERIGAKSNRLWRSTVGATHFTDKGLKHRGRRDFD